MGSEAEGEAQGDECALDLARPRRRPSGTSHEDEDPEQGEEGGEVPEDGCSPSTTCRCSSEAEVTGGGRNQAAELGGGRGRSRGRRRQTRRPRVDSCGQVVEEAEAKLPAALAWLGERGNVGDAAEVLRLGFVLGESTEERGTGGGKEQVRNKRRGRRPYAPGSSASWLQSRCGGDDIERAELASVATGLQEEEAEVFAKRPLADLLLLTSSPFFFCDLCSSI